MLWCTLWSWLCLGCGGAASGAFAGESKAGAPTQLAPAPLPTEQERLGWDEGAYGREESFDQGIQSPKKGGKPSQAYPEPNDGSKGKAPAADGERPLVVYTGFLRLRVRRLLETLDAITKATEARGGYIESLTQRAIVVRVPGKDFDGVMAEFSEFGDVLERNVEALDVTEQFTDLGARLVVAEDARARLMTLLTEVSDVEERLRILAEVKRLTEQIESIKSTLATLENLVEFFTITIELMPILEDGSAPEHRSPFEWVRDLSPHRTTLSVGKDEFSLSVPPGFVLFEKDDEFRAQAADTTVLRGAIVDNEPLGDEAFWSKAVHHEITGRGEKRVKRGRSGRVAYQIFKNDELKPRYYLVGVAVSDDRLFVLEVFFPNQKAFERHTKAVARSLSSFRPE